MKLFLACMGVLAAGLFGVPGAQAASDCPSGPVRYGVIPYDSSARFVPLYHRIGELISAKLGCPVQVEIGTSYTATIEAMRAGKIDAAEFGPLSYVLAHEVAKAEAVATYANAQGGPDTYTASIVTWPGSGITELKGVAGRSFAYSDPASTSGHLFPAYGLLQNGIDPDKVDAGELNSPEIASAEAAGIWDPHAFVTLWTSSPIPQDPITVRGDLPAAFKARLTEVLQHLDLRSIPAEELKITGIRGTGYVPQTDAALDGIRDLVHVLHIDLTKLNS